MKNKRNTLTFILLTILIIITLTSCDKIKEGILGTEATKGDSSDVAEKEEYTINDLKIFNLGDTVNQYYPSNEDPQNVGFELKFNKVTTYDNPQQAEVTKEKMIETEIYNINDEITLQSLDESYKKNFLLLDVNIKNIGYDDGSLPNIASIYLVYKDGNGKLHMISRPTYFANSKSFDDNNLQYYYYVDLKKGDSVNTQLGYSINIEDYKKENIYLAVDFENNIKEYVSIIDLKL